MPRNGARFRVFCEAKFRWHGRRRAVDGGVDVSTTSIGGPTTVITRSSANLERTTTTLYDAMMTMISRETHAPTQTQKVSPEKERERENERERWGIRDALINVINIVADDTHTHTHTHREMMMATTRTAFARQDAQFVPCPLCVSVCVCVCVCVMTEPLSQSTKQFICPFPRRGPRVRPRLEQRTISTTYSPPSSSFLKKNENKKTK